MNRSTLLSFLVFSAFSQLIYADMNSANASLARGDYAAASAEYLRLAKDGDAKAQAHLGYMYYVGEGVQQNYAEAISWYRKAAVQGNRDAQYNLAVAYAFGEGTKQDYKEAATWYRRAAEQGHVVSQYSLGISYSYGEGVKQDSVEAIKWFQKSAEQGYARSQVQLASKYHTGDGVALNYQQAVAWYRKAADRGNAAAQYNLGSMFRSGKGVTQDYNQAVRWYRMAADQGYAAATNELASLERAIAGASRTRSTPDLQPRPAPIPVEKVAEEKAPTEEPLLTVKKSDLLTLDSEEEQVEEAVMTETDVSSDISEDIEAADQMVSEEKKPGRVSGFFRKFFKKKETRSETVVLEGAEPDSIEEIQEVAETELVEEAVPVEDLSESMPEPVDEIAIEREVVSNEPEKKKSRFGFFKKLFSKKDPADAASVEDHTLADMDSADDVETTSDSTIAYGSEEALPGDEIADISKTHSDDIETALEEEVSEVESSTAMDASELEEQPKKKGFFRRLFSKKKDTAELMPEESEPMTADDIALVDDSIDDTPVMEEEVAVDTGIEDAAAMDAIEVEEKPKKKGFFKRLFSKKKDNVEDIPEESESMTADSIAMVDDGTNNIPVLEEEVTIDTSAEEDAAMDALEVDEKPKKKGFFKRLFGKSDEQDDSAADSGEKIVESDETESAQTSSEPEFVADKEDLAAGQQALDDSNYDTAFNTYYDLATSGDATAQYQLGLLYYQGLGIEQNYDEASHWYLQAGKQGNADAQYSLGNMFLMGEGVDQNDTMAIFWYEKAADQGHVAAQHNANNLKRVTAGSPSITAEEIESALENEQTEDGLSASGEAVEEKPKKGFFKRLFGKKDEVEESAGENVAVVQGPLPEIQSEPAAEMQVIEEEEVKEKKKGFFGRLFGKKAAEETALLEPEVEAEEIQSAVSSAPTGESGQSFEDALAAVNEYENGLAYAFGDGVAQDNSAAFAAFSRSAELGHAPAQYKTGIAYAYGEGVDKDLAQALYWYKKAAEQGYALAQRNLGVMYMNGDGVEQNKPLAFAWHSILADSGNVMDVHRRDSLQQKLSATELEEALVIKASLIH